MDNIQAIIAERQNIHGEYTDTARIIQSLKGIINNELLDRNERGQQPLNPVQLESLAMIVHKIGRIISGKPDFVDHWDDIAGYAKLVSDRIPPMKLPLTASVTKELEASLEHNLSNFHYEKELD